jgi:FkbM family methyltransferase
MPMNYFKKVVQSNVPNGFRRKVLIDGGFYIGQYTEAYLSKNPGFEVWAFDPIKIDSQFLSRVHFINQAIWIKDEIKSFYLSHRADAASLIDTRAVDIGRSIKVDCVDFSYWLKQNFTKDDYIHLKLDIEGAEYQVLQKMIDDGSIDLISELVCEWHIKISRQPNQELHKSLKQQLLSCNNIRLLKDWR